MRALLLCACAGLCLPIAFPDLAYLPAALVAAIVLALLLCRVLHGKERLLIGCLIAFAVGVGWHWCWATQRLQDVIPAEMQGEDLLVQGRVVSLPVPTENGQRFVFEVTNSSAWTNSELPIRLQLVTFLQEGTYDLRLDTGDYWQLLVRLKQPHGFANPGSRDSEAFLLRNHIAATGYVRSSESNRRLAGQAHKFSLTSLRSSIWEYLNRALSEHSQQDLMLALLMGEQSGISAQRWQLLSDTGTNHLFVISGLHIGLIAMVSFALSWRALAMLFGPVLSWPAQQFAAVIAIGASSAYSLMAGFSLPTQRALVMVAVFLSVYLSRRRLSLSLRYCLALMLVLLLDPLAATTPGFWLSFAAVGVLILFASPPLTVKEELTVPAKALALFRESWRSQWAVFAGLLLPLHFWMGQVSPIAPFVNLLAIPLVGLLLVPLLLVALLISLFWIEAGAVAFTLCNGLLELLIRILGFAGAIGEVARVSPVHPGLVSYAFAALGVVFALLPKGTPCRYLFLPFCLPLLFPAIEKPGRDELWVDVLDVGQGLSVLLRTREHSLLYDTGAGSPAGWSAAAAIVIPALQRFGVSALDTLMVSHGDNDHAGGVDVILDAYPGVRLMTNGGDSQCRAGEHWRWDGVEFTILHPEQTGLSSNNDSCVLRVQAGSQAVLLPGDIESDVEWELASRLGTRLASDLLIAPHHGSASSSSYPFLKLVNPEQVVFSAGYFNGFSHPAQQIEARYHGWGIASYNTAYTGMVSVRLGGASLAGSLLAHPERYRYRHRKYWSWSGNPPSCRYC